MFPSILNTFPRPSTTSRLDNPSHSNLHNTVSSALGQVEAFIGRDGNNSVAGTILYDVRSPASDGGGHVQSAVKGGTGQTTFTKGDILVASGPSTLSKLAVSATPNDVLVVDSSQAVGVKWATNPFAAKVAITTTTSSIYNTNTEEVLFATSILGSTLGTNNAVKFKGVMRLNRDTNGSFTIRAKYGLNSVFSINMPALAGDFTSTMGILEGTIVGNTSVALQQGFGEFYASQNGGENKADLTVGYTKNGGMAFGTSSVESSATQNLVITGQFSSAQVGNSVLGRFFVVEKIV